MFSVKLGGYVIANAIVSKAEINYETDWFTISHGQNQLMSMPPELEPRSPTLQKKGLSSQNLFTMSPGR